MRRLAVFAQNLQPLGEAYDGVDPLHWLPAWRWTRVNDVWTDRGGGLFSAVKNAVLGILDIGVNGGFLLASLIWEVTTTMLSWALTPSLFKAFEDVVDTTGFKLLGALGFTNAVTGASVFAAILLLAVGVSAVRFARNPAAGVKTLLRSFIPLSMCAVLVGTTVAEITNTHRQGQLGGTSTAATVPGSLKWMYQTLDKGRSLMVEGVVQSAELFSSIGDPPGTVYGCDSYRLALENLYRQDATAAGWGKAQIEAPVVVSRMWQAVYLDQFSAAQVGIHSSKRASCWTAEVRENSVAPIEIFAVWDYTCTLDREHHLHGCDPGRDYDAEQLQRAEAVFAPSDFDDHEWRSALTLWAMCDWRGQPSRSLINGRNDLSPGARRTLLEMATSHDVVAYDNRTLAMLAGADNRVIYDPAFVGVRNARDSDKYMSAETCETYRFGQGNTANQDRDGAWGLWAKWVTDRANIEPDDGADSRRHALGMPGDAAPASGDRNIQKDTVDSINGSSWSGRLMYAVVTVLTAALYGFSLVGMGLGTLIAQFLVGGIVAIMPLLLVLMALPVKGAQGMPRKVFKLLLTALFAHLLFLVILSLVIMCIGVLNQVLGGVTGTGFVRSMLFAIVPLISLFAVGAITKQFGLKITNPKGAILAASGIALVGLRQPNLGVSQYANRARSRYDQISDRSDVRRESQRLEAQSGEAGVRVQPRMQPPSTGQPELALNSQSSPAAIAAGALATMGGRIPRGPGRGAGRGPGTGTRPTVGPGLPGQPHRPPGDPAPWGPTATPRPDTPARTPRESDAPAAPLGGRVATTPRGSGPAGAPADAPAASGGGPPPTSVLPPRRPPPSPSPPPSPQPDGAPTPGPTSVHGDGATAPPGVQDPGSGTRTQPQRLDPPDASDTGTAEGTGTGPAGPARRPKAAESVETAAVKAGRAAKAAQWGTLKAGRWARDHRRAIKRVALGSIVAMGALGMSAAAAPLALGYAGAKFVGWRYRRQLQRFHMVRSPEERAEERFERRQQRQARRNDREVRVEQRMRTRHGKATTPADPSSPGLPPTAVVGPRQDRPPVGSPQQGEPGQEPRPSDAGAPLQDVRLPDIAEPEPQQSPESVDPRDSASPTEMSGAQAGYLADLSASAGLDPSGVFEAVGGSRVRASEAIDVLRGGAPPDGAPGSLMERVVDATSRVRMPSQRPDTPPAPFPPPHPTGDSSPLQTGPRPGSQGWRPPDRTSRGQSEQPTQ
ncbi:MAG: hypothetical protein F4Z31_01810 [Gemmatimonadetes bacterium]|nr:hypothetical protein [Gemmatimonadota bacterium]